MKFGLSESHLFARLDLRTRWAASDVEELKDLFDTTASVVDAAYPEIRKFVAEGK